MRLCSLELQGFKSFPDKTYLEFDDGITAVVGPNGSGKSNIADGIRWVLGEQSTKTLRGGKMEDVIFSGTQLRKSVGYASVKLTIDGVEDVLPDQKADKITIGRRLYRSGESEYRINGDIVRLKDVHELFMDTGLGRDGYSIIGQGRIAEIVSAKSAQRREIFEEAAGIAKFRYRRTEAQRKLDGAQENLIRLNDILSELEDRVEPLRIQSEKAKKYIEFADERKGLEISIWVENLDRLKGQTSQQGDKINISKNDYEHLETTGEAMEQELTQVYEKMQRLVVAADERRNAIKVFEEEISESDAKIAVLNNDIQHNNKALDHLLAQKDGAGKGEEELSVLIAEKEQTFEIHATALKALQQEMAAKKAEIINQLDEFQKMQQQLDGLRARKNSLGEAVAQIQLEQAASQSIVSDSKQRLVDLQERDSEHDTVVAEYKANADECRKMIAEWEEQIRSLENTRSGYSMKRDSRLAKHRTLEDKKEAMLKEIQQLSSRVKLLEEMESTMEGYAGSVKYILNQSKKGSIGGVYGAVSSLISTEEEYITAVETALGGAMQNLVVEDESIAKRGIAMLRDAKAGRATFLPLTSVKGQSTDFSNLKKHVGFIGSGVSLISFDPKFTGVMNQLLGRICVVDDLNTGTVIAKESGYRFRIVTLDGQVINAGGSYTGGAVYRSAGVLGRRSEIEQMEQKEKELSGKIQDFEPELAHSTQEVASLEATLTGVLAEIRSAEEEVVRLGFSREQLERSLDSAEKNRDLAKDELDKLAHRLKQLEEGKASAQQLIAENAKEVNNLEEELHLAEEHQQQLSATTNENRTLLSDYQMKELSSEKDGQSMEEEIGRLKAQAENADEQAKQLEEESQRLESDNRRIDGEIASLVERRGNLSEQVTAHNESITQCMDQRTQLEKSTTDLRQKERELSGKREEISRELARLEERFRGMQSEYDSIISKLWDEYELTRSGAVEQAQPLKDMAKATLRLTDLKNQIRGLGSVNLDAVEEYKEVGERYEFLSKQVADVETARAQLHKLIGDLTGEMRTLFEDNFNKIAAEFSTIFVELFGGGHGELLLEDSDDVLEAGIAIHVQPPGKVIKNLTLLSGGEQAFIAIAIYFAILKVKPAPFVLLDEIEAALDDVNVVKYATYLRTLAGHIQFIAITHRRGTMEEADVLYGVTMQEEGVSKLLELRVNEIESKLGMEAD